MSVIAAILQQIKVNQKKHIGQNAGFYTSGSNTVGIKTVAYDGGEQTTTITSSYGGDLIGILFRPQAVTVYLDQFTVDIDDAGEVDMGAGWSDAAGIFTPDADLVNTPLFIPIHCHYTTEAEVQVTPGGSAGNLYYTIIATKNQS